MITAQEALKFTEDKLNFVNQEKVDKLLARIGQQIEKAAREGKYQASIDFSLYLSLTEKEKRILENRLKNLGFSSYYCHGYVMRKPGFEITWGK